MWVPALTSTPATPSWQPCIITDPEPFVTKGGGSFKQQQRGHSIQLCSLLLRQCACPAVSSSSGSVVSGVRAPRSSGLPRLPWHPCDVHKTQRPDLGVLSVLGSPWSAVLPAWGTLHPASCHEGRGRELMGKARASLLGTDPKRSLTHAADLGPASQASKVLLLGSPQSCLWHSALMSCALSQPYGPTQAPCRPRTVHAWC